MAGLSRRELFRRVAGAGAGIVSAGLLAACVAPVQQQQAGEAGAAPEEETATIRFGMWGSAGAGVSAPVQEFMLTDYMSKNPNHEVKLELAPWSDYWDKLQVQIAGSTAPDIVWMSGAMFMDLKERNAFRNLASYVERDQVELEGFWSEPLYTEGEDVWAMHFYTMVHALYYNREMFAEAGLAEPPMDWNDPSWTWADFREAANALTGPNAEGQPQWGVELYNSMEWGWGTFILSNGASVLSPDLTQATTDSPEFMEAIQFLVDIIHTDQTSPAPGDPSAALGAGLVDNFQAGRVAMRTGNNSRLPNYLIGNDFEWAPCVPPRASAEKDRLVYWLENPFCMTNSTQQPEVAWNLLRYIGTVDGQQAIAHGKIGMPSLIEFARDPDGQFLQPPPDNLELFPNGMVGNHTTDLQFTKQWLRWVTVMQQELDPAFLGEKSVEECCLNAKREVDKVLTGI